MSQWPPVAGVGLHGGGRAMTIGGITSRFGAGETQTIRRIPFRIVLVGDFGLGKGRMVSLEADDIDTVLSSARPSRQIVVDDHLGGGQPLALDIEIGSLRDFAPRRLIETVPVFAEAMAGRGKGGGTALPPVDQRAEPSASAGSAAASSPPPAPTPSSTSSAEDSDDPLDRILGMVDAPSRGSSPASAPSSGDAGRKAVSAFVRAMPRTRTPSEPSAEPPDQSADDRIANQIAAILNAPGFRSFEAAWASARFLLRRCDRRARVFLHLLDVGEDAEPDDAAAVAEAVLIEGADDQPAGIGLIVSILSLGAGQVDVSAMQALASVGEAIQVPVCVPLADTFLQDVDDEALQRMQDPETLMDRPGYDTWHSLRSKEPSRWLAVTVGRIALRGPHDLVSDRRVGLTRSPAAEAVGRTLEAEGSVIIAALTAQSMAEREWPSEITGGERAVDGLDLPTEPETGWTGGTATRPSLGPSGAASFGNAGITALVGRPGRDSAGIVRAPTVHRYKPLETGESPAHAHLGYQLVVSRLIRLIEANADTLFAQPDAASRARAVQAFFNTMLAPTGPEASVSVSLSPDDPPMLDITLSTGRAILGGVTLTLELPA